MGPGKDQHTLFGVVNHFPGTYQGAIGSGAAYPTVRERESVGTAPADLSCGHSVTLYSVIDEESLTREERTAVCESRMDDAGSG